MAGIKKCGCYYYSHPHFDKVMSVSPLQIYIYFFEIKKPPFVYYYSTTAAAINPHLLLHTKNIIFFSIGKEKPPQILKPLTESVRRKIAAAHNG